MALRAHACLSWNPILPPPPVTAAGVGFTFHARESDWGLSGARRFAHQIRQCRHAIDAADGATLVLANAGMEVLVAVILRALRRQKYQIVAVDMLLPPKLHTRRALGVLLRRVDHFVCIRRGDIGTLVDQFGVAASACSFAPFPAPTQTFVTTDDGYVYAGGIVHRDWAGLIDAARQWKHPSVFAVESRPNAPANVSFVGALSPEEGRARMAGARVVVSAITDTVLPAGPLVLLDSMAMAKPIVATDVRATRDYVEDGVDALVVAPGDAGALADAVNKLMSDEQLRGTLAANARTRAATLTAERFWNAVAEAVTAAA